MYRCQNINRFKGPIITTRNGNGLRGRANSQWICLQQPKHQRDLWLRWKFSFMIEVNVIVFFFFFIMLYIQCGYNFFFCLMQKWVEEASCFSKILIQNISNTNLSMYIKTIWLPPTNYCQLKKTQIFLLIICKYQMNCGLSFTENEVKKRMISKKFQFSMNFFEGNTIFYVL